MRDNPAKLTGTRIVTTTSNPHTGASLDDVLEADDVLAEAQAVALKRVRGCQAGQVAAADDNGALKLEVVFEIDEDGWVVASCPTLAGCHSQGRTRDEALANSREAVEGYLGSMGTYGDAAGVAFRLESVSGSE